MAVNQFFFFSFVQGNLKMSTEPWHFNSGGHLCSLHIDYCAIDSVGRVVSTTKSTQVILSQSTCIKVTRPFLEVDKLKLKSSRLCVIRFKRYFIPRWACKQQNFSLSTPLGINFIYSTSVFKGEIHHLLILGHFIAMTYKYLWWNICRSRLPRWC